VYEIVSKNVVEPERPQLATLRRGACIRLHARKHTLEPVHPHPSRPPPTHTHALAHTPPHAEICNTYCFSMATVVWWTRLNVTSYVHCVIWRMQWAIWGTSPQFSLLCLLLEYFTLTDTCHVVTLCIVWGKRSFPLRSAGWQVSTEGFRFCHQLTTRCVSAVISLEFHVYCAV
jgi:hypothetical protein